MLKLASLRALIEQCLPELARDPERLKIVGEGGRIIATGTQALSFEYRYTAFVTILDYAGHADALFVPLLAWMQVNQGEQLDNPKAREEAIEFEVHHLNESSADIGIWLQLTERAIVRRQPQPGSPGRLTITHPEEPLHAGEQALPGQQDGQQAMTERWELWLKDKKLAEWDAAPPIAREWFKPALR